MSSTVTACAWGRATAARPCAQGGPTRGGCGKAKESAHSTWLGCGKAKESAHSTWLGCGKAEESAHSTWLGGGARPSSGGHDEGPGSAWCGSRPFGRSDLDGQAGTTSKVRVAATSGCRRTVAS